MTSSNYQSLAMFLNACDLPDNEIQKYVWEIKHLVEINPRMNKEF